MISISLGREGVFVTMDGATTRDDKARFDEAMRRIRAMGTKSKPAQKSQDAS